jgi:hypothetical protein
MDDNYTAVFELEYDLGQCQDEADAYAAAEEVVLDFKNAFARTHGVTILDVEKW